VNGAAASGLLGNNNPPNVELFWARPVLYFTYRRFRKTAATSVAFGSNPDDPTYCRTGSSENLA